MSPTVIPDVQTHVHDLAACRQQYMAAFRCATFLSSTTKALTLISDQYAAVLTSDTRGTKIAKTLLPRKVPIVSVRSAVWMFITARPLPADDLAAMISTLSSRSGTLLVLPGEEIALPTPGSDRRKWITPLGEFPPFGDVVDATIRVTTKEASR
ncbi:hypothetical protein [Nocardia sp. NPDC051570]|uniref:hypothetical protein n=1 Tax=Nocardia sp. NPDC051570 TaxID=3364324 RepID=UPI0037A17B82